jgi:uncharacterized membrane protein YdjX (TVP38/TMEM64 family)
MDIPLTWLRKKRVWGALALASLLAVLISHMPIASWLTNAHGWLASQGAWALPTFIVLYIVAAIFGLPNIVLILAAGTLFGLAKGVISASIADTLSIAACFVVGQTVGRRWITSVVRENSRFHRLDRAFSQKGWKIVLLTRLSPLLPSNILNYGFSLTRINFWEYLFFSWLGMLPVIFTYVYVGTFGANILTLDSQPKNLVFQALGLAATVGVMFYATKLAASALNVKEDHSDRPDSTLSSTLSNDASNAARGSAPSSSQSDDDPLERADRLNAQAQTEVALIPLSQAPARAVSQRRLFSRF